MILGVDLDNTLVCYDGTFHRAALARGLIPPGLARTKDAVRDYLRAIGREDDWTELQGFVYGDGMAEADAYPGVKEFFSRCRERGVPVRIISHRTRRPFRGPGYDLHKAALDWLASKAAFDPVGWGLGRGDVFLELSKANKLSRIAACGCSHFIDDLPEFLAEADFPGGVQKILFDPNDCHVNADVPRIRSWREANALLDCRTNGCVMPTDASEARHESWHGALDALLAGTGLYGPYTLTPIPHRGNNRAFRLDLPSGPLMLKRYFMHAADPRDRLGAEFNFVSYAWNHGLRMLPRAVACSRDAGLGLYEFIFGRKATRKDVDAHAVTQAAEFAAEVNRHRGAPDALALEPASEACFSVADHLAQVDRRVAHLARIAVRDETDRYAIEFVHEALMPRWASIRETAGITTVDSPVAPGDVCLSPSDFGFHNVLLARDGGWRFIDFEYAGWDDPAKMICDFFCQPQVPVGIEHFELFVDRVALLAADPRRCAARARSLLPTYRIKWCCILLNEFLPVGRERRAFAAAAEEGDEPRRRQLEKARVMLEQVDILSDVGANAGGNAGNAAARKKPAGTQRESSGV